MAETKWVSLAHRIHGTNGIFTYIYIWFIFMANVGKYTVRPMGIRNGLGLFHPDTTGSCGPRAQYRTCLPRVRKTGGIASYLGLLSWFFSEPMVDGEKGFHMRFLVMAEKRLIDSNEISVHMRLYHQYFRVRNMNMQYVCIK